MAALTDAASSDDLVSDIYSLSDHQLAANLEFIQEIGYGNWGSVWSCRSRVGSPSQTRRRLAVKLVHRTSARTTPARVRSLWNEMKIVRTLKEERHPAIIDFHSFIITPSYALITMEYLPRLVPVEVREPKAKTWFESLLSGVAYLHARGIVHNDIKPANILLSRSEQPVLVDFGFGEKYDLNDGSPSTPKLPSLPGPSIGSSPSPTPKTPTAPFESNLAYGTPEYLSPERARGYKHDTRKSDVWSLGVTFFEIIVGRTPFELDEGEEFSSKEDLERYWDRTNKGTWVGVWKMSSGLEKVLKKMIHPKPDVRATATKALQDAYFSTPLVDAEIVSAIRIDVQAKKVIQTVLPSESLSPPSFAAGASTSHMSPMVTAAPGSARAKLTALQNLIGKQPQLPNTPKPRAASHKPVNPPPALAQKENSQSVASPKLNQTPSSLSRSFFSTHLRSKSHAEKARSPLPLNSSQVIDAPPASKSPGVTATPKVVKNKGKKDAPIPAAPPPTPASVAVPPSSPAPPVPALIVEPSGSDHGLEHEHPPTAILKLHPILPPSSADTSTEAPSFLAFPVPPSDKSMALGSRDVLRPIAGKENSAGIKIKAKHGADSQAKQTENTEGTVKGGKSMLRIKARNRKAQVLADITPAGENAASNQDARPVTKRGAANRGSSPMNSKKENFNEPVHKKDKSRRSSFQLTFKSTDGISRPSESGFSSLRHSVRKSIDKTAEQFSKMSTAAGSISRRGGKLRKSTTELRQSWEDLERERDLKAVVNLPAVTDESYDESTMVASASDEKTAEESAGKTDRMTLWIKSVEKVVEETRHEFQREASNPVSRSSSRGGMLDSRPSSAMGPIPLSLPPPKRRATVSSTLSRRPSTTDGHHKSRSVLELGLGRAPSIRSVDGGPVEGKRLSAILCPSDRKLFLEGRNPSKQPSCSSFASSVAHNAPKRVPTIEVMDTSGYVDSSNEVPPCCALSVEPTKSHQSPDTALDDARLNHSVSSGFYLGSRNPLSFSRSMSLSPPPISASYTALAANPSPPQSLKDEEAYERALLSTSSVVRHGKGYQSDQSLRPTSPSFYQVHHPSTEFILASKPDSVDGPRSRSQQSQNNSLSAKTKSHRRGGIFATLRGREQAEAVAFAREFGALQRPIESPTFPSDASLDPEHEGSKNDRSNTLTLRMKRAIMRVVSPPVTTRAIAPGVPS